MSVIDIYDSTQTKSGRLNGPSTQKKEQTNKNLQDIRVNSTRSNTNKNTMTNIQGKQTLKKMIGRYWKIYWKTNERNGKRYFK